MNDVGMNTDGVTDPLKKTISRLPLIKTEKSGISDSVDELKR